MKLVFEIEIGNGNRINQIFRDGITVGVMQRMLDQSEWFEYYTLEVDLDQCKKIKIQAVEV
jgi:hypothetical protein